MSSSPVDFSGFDPNTGAYDTSGFAGPVNTTIEGPILNTPGIVPTSSVPANDPYSVGGILNGIGSVLGGVSKLVVAGKVSTGNVSPLYIRPQGAGALGVGSSSSGLLSFVLLGAVAYVIFKKKRA